MDGVEGGSGEAQSGVRVAASADIGVSTSAGLELHQSQPLPLKRNELCGFVSSTEHIADLMQECQDAAKAADIHQKTETRHHLGDEVYLFGGVSLSTTPLMRSDGSGVATAASNAGLENLAAAANGRGSGSAPKPPWSKWRTAAPTPPYSPQRNATLN